MHRLPRWPVGIVASLLGSALLLIRWGGTRVVESAAGSPGKMGALLSAVQNEPAGVVYGAIVFLLLVGFPLLIPTSKWRKWVTGRKQRRDFIAPCDVLAVLVDRPVKLKSSALSASSIRLIPSSSSWL